jgi:toluene monooxygenase system protein E
MESRASVTEQRTYWHLEGQQLGSPRRKPQPYDIVTSKLLYHPERGFEVSTPGAAWMQRYGAGSRLRGSFQAFRDPRATTYARYVELQAEQESFLEQLFLAAEETGYDAGLAPAWLDVLEAVLPVLRYPSHALHMLAAYVAQLAPEGRVVVAGAFQAADELRRLQHWAQRMRQLQERRAGFGQAAREHWQCHGAWQPLRQLLEHLLVTYDFGEALVALELVVKPALDELFLVEFAALARERGDYLFAQLAHSLERDCRWQRDWSDALVRAALAEHPENQAPLREWLARWWPPLQAALPALVSLWAVEPERALVVAAQIELKCRARWGALAIEP